MTTKTPKKHKQRFEHKVLSSFSAEMAEEICIEEQKKGYELVATTLKTINDDLFTLFFKRPV